MGVIGRVLDWSTDHIGHAYLAGLAALTVAGLVVAAVAAVAIGAWWALLAVAVLPAVWFAIWRSGD